jgi:hypothetical protein
MRHNSNASKMNWPHLSLARSRFVRDLSDKTIPRIAAVLLQQSESVERTLVAKGARSDALSLTAVCSIIPGTVS